jgi:hypothetical protein
MTGRGPPAGLTPMTGSGDKELKRPLPLVMAGLRKDGEEKPWACGYPIPTKLHTVHLQSLKVYW